MHSSVPNAHVGCENRCGPEMALAFIAAGIAGTCAPLNPHYTAAEYEFYLTELTCQPGDASLLP